MSLSNPATPTTPSKALNTVNTGVSKQDDQIIAWKKLLGIRETVIAHAQRGKIEEITKRARGNFGIYDLYVSSLLLTISSP